MICPRILIPKSVKHDHDELRGLIGWAMSDLDDTTEVHVKARALRYCWEVRRRLTDGGFHVHGGPKASLVARYGAENVARFTDWGPYWTSGRAYDGVPEIANVGHGTDRLVTLCVPNPDAFACNSYPLERVYRGKEKSSRDWPRLNLTGWCDDVVSVAAHEARHILQFTNGDPASEMDAERYSFARLAEWREATVSA